MLKKASPVLAFCFWQPESLTLRFA